MRLSLLSLLLLQPLFVSFTLAFTTTTTSYSQIRGLAIRRNDEKNQQRIAAAPRVVTSTEEQQQSHHRGRHLSSTINDNDDNTSGQLSRRQINELLFATTGLGISYFGSKENNPTDYGLWGILPIGTYKSKKTIMETIIPNEMWTFDQKFGILNVQVPIRMTIVKLSTGGLIVYNPIAATKELITMVQEFVDQYGPIKHIVVGSVALEHKVYGGVFTQKFTSRKSKPTVWLTPGQYSVPVNLPEAPYLGYPTGGRTKYLTPSTIKNELPGEITNDFQLDVLGPIISRDGAFGETTLYHKSSKTLIVTDTCVQVTDEVPPIYNSDPKPLLYHARDTITDDVADTPETRKKGWKRIVLFGLFFQPSAIMIKDVNTAINERRPDINSDFLGIYPWDWVGNEDASWTGLTGSSMNKPLVAPILQVLLLNRSPVEVLDFAKKVGSYDIKRIIPSHLKNNLKLTGDDYYNSFKFLTADGVPNGYPKPLQADLQTLVDAEKSLIESGAIVKAPPKIGTKNVSRQDIIDQTIYRCRTNTCAPKANS